MRDKRKRIRPGETRSALNSKRTRSAGEGERGAISREGREIGGAAVPLVPDDKTKELPMTADRVKAPAFRGAEVIPAQEDGLLAVIGLGLVSSSLLCPSVLS